MQAFMGQPTLILDAVAVTPDDTERLAATKGLYVGGVGDLSVVFEQGTADVVFTGVEGFLPFKVTRINDTGTTATDIIALY